MDYEFVLILIVAVIQNGKCATISVDAGGCKTGQFTSPGFPNNYPVNSDETWILTADPGKKILITFPSFELEAGPCDQYDFLQILEDGVEIQIYCGDITVSDYLSTTNVVTVVFHSDDMIGKPGFEANWSVDQCETQIDATGCKTGTFTSPNYPSNYPAGSDEAWILTAESGKKILIEFLSFELEDGPCDQYDFLQIIENGVEQEIYCGDITVADYLSTTNVVTVVFHSDDMIGKPGFEANWSVDQCDLVSMPAGCKNGQFTSPNYPSNYPTNSDETWILTTDAGKHILITFPAFNLELAQCDSYDFLQIIENGVEQAIYCGDIDVPDYISTTNEVKVVFHSDDFIQKSGFEAVWMTECNSCTLTDCVRTSAQPSCRQSQCGWGAYIMEFTCPGDVSVKCYHDCHSCTDGPTYPECEDVASYDPGSCTLVNETPCSSTHGVGLMLQKHDCGGSGVTCARTCCCQGLPVGMKPTPAIHCGSPGMAVNQRETDCPGYEITF